MNTRAVQTHHLWQSPWQLGCSSTATVSSLLSRKTGQIREKGRGQLDAGWSINKTWGENSSTPHLQTFSQSNTRRHSFDLWCRDLHSWARNRFFSRRSSAHRTGIRPQGSDCAAPLSAEHGTPQLFAALIINTSSVSCHEGPRRLTLVITQELFACIHSNLWAVIWLLEIRCLPELLWIPPRCSPSFHYTTYSGIFASWSARGLGWSWKKSRCRFITVLINISKRLILPN